MTIKTFAEMREHGAKLIEKIESKELTVKEAEIIQKVYISMTESAKVELSYAKTQACRPFIKFLEQQK